MPYKSQESPNRLTGELPETPKRPPSTTSGDVKIVELKLPSEKYKPQLSIDGDMWCALYGENLQDGVAGFGKSPQLAMDDFDKNFVELLS